MKRSVVLTGLGILAFFAMAWASPVSSLEAPSEEKIPKEIEGLWTEIWCENGGKETAITWPLREPDSPPKIWKFFKEEIQVGWDDHMFPQCRFTYKLNPGNKAGAIDFIGSEKNKPELGKGTWQAIYLQKDDYLIICWDKDERPAGFTTSGKTRPTRWLYILRRGQLK
jgi:uncharacterized protein (TIGR03067 family)